MQLTAPNRQDVVLHGVPDERGRHPASTYSYRSMMHTQPDRDDGSGELPSGGDRPGTEVAGRTWARAVGFAHER